MASKPGTDRERPAALQWLRVLVLLAAGLAAVGCARTAREAAFGKARLEPAAVDPVSIGPGLAVLYFDDFYRNVDEMPSGAAALKQGRPGKPVPNLDYRFGNGPVLDSGLSRGVGVRMTGLMRFPTAGKYLLKARSNDGVRIFIDGEKIIDDPDVHSDRYSAEAAVQIDRSGWYPLRVQYFQRKGSATLELYWKMPGQGGFEIVPAASFGHVAKTD